MQLPQQHVQISFVGTGQKLRLQEMLAINLPEKNSLDFKVSTDILLDLKIKINLYLWYK